MLYDLMVRNMQNCHCFVNVHSVTTITTMSTQKKGIVLAWKPCSILILLLRDGLQKKSSKFEDQKKKTKLLWKLLCLLMRKPRFCLFRRTLCSARCCKTAFDSRKRPADARCSLDPIEDPVALLVERLPRNESTVVKLLEIMEAVFC